MSSHNHNIHDTEIPIQHVELSKQFLHDAKKRDSYKTKKLADSNIKLHGQQLNTCRNVQIRTGPVIGKVESTNAIVLVEVSTIADLELFLVPSDNTTKAATIHVPKQRFPQNRPGTFIVKGLKPETSYWVLVSGVSAKSAKNNIGHIKTSPFHTNKMNIVAVSCDRPERQLNGETNMWKVLGDRIDKGEVDLMIHVGDQVYAEKESIDAAAVFRHSNHNDFANGSVEQTKALKKIYHRAQDRLRDVYRYTWGLPYTAKVLRTCPHLMIWSDNDIFNDFTIAKGASPLLIHLGQQTYREYQRALWDSNIHDDYHHSEEQHFHKYGNIGVMMLDMRGNRVDVDGNQRAESEIISPNQWKQIDDMLHDPEITAVLVASEIPFVTDPPDVIKKGAAKVPFLVDHWGYNDKELFALLDRIFDWKAASGGKKDAVLIGGDIHVGVDSMVKDHKTGCEIRQITTSPITNHVCGFFPKHEGQISERYSYVHKPLDLCRNYGYFQVTANATEGKIVSSLIAGAPTAGDH